MIKYWRRLSRDTTESTLQEIFKTRLDHALDNLKANLQQKPGPDDIQKTLLT